MLKIKNRSRKKKQFEYVFFDQRMNEVREEECRKTNSGSNLMIN